jgi:hypothetical protein
MKLVKGRKSRLLAAMAIILVSVVLCSMTIWKAQMISGVGASWRGITTGQSTASDVIAVLGVPTAIEDKSGRIVYLYQEGQYEWAIHRIVIKDDVVELVEEDVLAYSYDMDLVDLVDQYGSPDHIVWSKEGPGLRAAVYVDEGIFAHVIVRSSSRDQVARILYFEPRSLPRLLVDFRDEISLCNPFPDSDVIGPRDPWLRAP